MATQVTALRGDALAWIEQVRSADVVVGIPSFKNAATIGNVVRVVGEGLAKYLPTVKAAIVNSDGGSLDGTREVVRNTPVPKGVSVLATEYQGIPGKGSAFHAIFEIAAALGAKASVVVDSDLRSITPEWINRLGEPILHQGFGYIAPLYVRHKHDGTITNNITYPMTRMLYGLDMRHVTVSAVQQARLAALYGIPPERIAVVPPGIDPAQFWSWTSMTHRLVSKLELLEADILLLLPARLTRRKNVEMALRILAALRRLTGQDVRLIVTGPPGPHNPANAAYLSSLLNLRRALGLSDAAHLLYELDVTPDDATMANLYQLADALLFPSMREGFGIPVLEAGLARLPIFCADIPPLRETGASSAHYFDPRGAPDLIAAQIADALLCNATHSLRRRVLSTYTWKKIVEERVIPLPTRDE